MRSTPASTANTSTAHCCRFNVEFSPMASSAFEPGKPGEDAIEVARLVERSLKQSHAVDTEALCVVAGRKVRSSC
jgi:exosome complex component RRP45